MAKYYLDACIWRDYFENRSDKFRPLGEWAFRLIKKIINENDLVVYSDLVEEELNAFFSDEELITLISVFPEHIFIKIQTKSSQLKEAVLIASRLEIPRKDVLHAILARDENAVLITRDKHFDELREIVEIYKPEDLI